MSVKYHKGSLNFAMLTINTVVRRAKMKVLGILFYE
jgi:hypothetical protein